MINWIEQFRRDIHFGVRGLIGTPGFSALAILSLALGIMATTAIYSVLHAVVLDPFPYKDIGNLMSVRVSNPALRGGRTGYSVDQFLEIAERNTIFEGVIASTISDVLWIGDGDPQRLRGNHGTFNTFDVMGVPPLVGRTPNANDARPDAEPVVVLGYRFWQRQFNGDPGVRTKGDPGGLTRPVTAQVYAVDTGQPVSGVQTLERLLRENVYATPRFNLVLLSIFAALGLALAVVGVYGVMSTAVAQERQEIGVRIALGADAGTIARMILLRGSRLLLAGTALGLVGSFAAGRWLAGQVWRVAGFDPIAFGAVAVLLLAVGLQACYWPARRAARTDPLIAIRAVQ